MGHALLSRDGWDSDDEGRWMGHPLQHGKICIVLVHDAKNAPLECSAAGSCRSPLIGSGDREFDKPLK